MMRAILGMGGIITSDIQISNRNTGSVPGFPPATEIRGVSLVSPLVSPQKYGECPWFPLVSLPAYLGGRCPFSWLAISLFTVVIRSCQDCKFVSISLA